MNIIIIITFYITYWLMDEYYVDDFENYSDDFEPDILVERKEVQQQLNQK